MTGTVIDSLVVELTLDAKGTVKGSQQAEGVLKRLRARLTDNAKGIEQAHARVAESVRNVREQVLGLLTVVTAGRGLNAFFQETSANVVATRSFSQTIDTSTASLGKWEAAARMAGGSAEGIRQTFASISSSVSEWDLNKTFSPQLQQMQRSGIAVLDGKTGNALSTEQIFKNALRYLSTIKDMRRRTQQARSFGFGDGVLPLVNSGSIAIMRMLHEAQEDGAEVTEKQAKANTELVHSQERLTTSFTALGRQIESDFAPQMAVVNDLIRATTNTIRQHQTIADAAFAGVSTTALALGVAMAGPFVAGFVAANAGVLALAAGFGAVVTAGSYFYSDWSAWMRGGSSEFSAFYQSVSNGWAQIEQIGSRTLTKLRPEWEAFERGAEEGWKAFTSLFTEDSDTIRARWLVLTGDASDAWGKAMTSLLTDWEQFKKAIQTDAPAIRHWLESMLHRGEDAAKSAWHYVEEGSAKVGHYIGGRAEAMHGLLAPRGIRNNNPGNLRSWAGAGSDGQFAQFATPEAGLNAMAQNLQTYMRKRGLQSVRGIISRWAPASDGNLTNDYIAQVSKDMGVTSDARLNASDVNTVASLMHAITRRENGYDPYAGLNQAAAQQAIAHNQGGGPTQEVHHHAHNTFHVTVTTRATDARGTAHAVSRELATITNTGLN
ncbi:hypothetical protein [Acetobacter sp. P5B1]|uniref:hypothetical protein n=1 Tax=Acetobacter sp. P5B1 TaxID=2762620 RepID=UPI001C05A262|nr:hypothetical protein [Acetobacter sp. P5B1]